VRTPEGNGYFKTRLNGRQVREHVAVAERAIGKPLPRGALVHHVDQDRSNNDPSNLVICPDDAYHMLLHRRQRALEACGNADWVKCWVCKTYSPPELIIVNGKNTHHRACINQWQAQARVRRQEKAPCL
jgi:hypothetical protein